MVVERLRSSKFQSLTLTFEGVGHFRNEVLFVKIKNDTEFLRLNQLAGNFSLKLNIRNLYMYVFIEETVKTSFNECDIISTDNRPFTPHLTIAKLSKDPTLYRKKVKKIEPILYQEYADLHFGIEQINCT